MKKAYAFADAKGLIGGINGQTMIYVMYDDEGQIPELIMGVF